MTKPLAEGEVFLVDGCNIASNGDLTFDSFLKLSFNSAWDDEVMVCIFEKNNCNEAKIK